MLRSRFGVNTTPDFIGGIFGLVSMNLSINSAFFFLLSSMIGSGSIGLRVISFGISRIIGCILEI
ncbi:hypothetical protein [Flavobacterium sp. 1]|uniref:hypothetical protein n=1 Tax=Flavobacterium sp. 1 TaxID=2035200 RepID=UPI00351934DB